MNTLALEFMWANSKNLALVKIGKGNQNSVLYTRLSNSQALLAFSWNMGKISIIYKEKKFINISDSLLLYENTSVAQFEIS